MKYEHSATIVRGDSAEGAQMLARFAEQRYPSAMSDAGFKDVSDFWEPWCIAIKGEEIAAIAFAARLGAAARKSASIPSRNFAREDLRPQ